MKRTTKKPIVAKKPAAPGPKAIAKAIPKTLSNDPMRRLIDAARAIRERAYAPYSRYHVGAAVLADNGRIYAAANVENASYGLSICAERNAVAAAINDGARQIEACAVATMSSPPAAPCGMCRQTLMEFAPRDPNRVRIAMVNPDGVRRDTTLGALLPLAFRTEDLG